MDNNQNILNSPAFRQLRENWNWFLVLGIGLIVLGALALVYATTATVISVIYLGMFLIIAGFFEGAKALKINQWGTFFLHLFLCLLYIACGAYMIYNPLLNAVTLTLLLALFFVVSGIFRIGFAISQNIPHKGWLIFNGVCGIILGILIWQQWPISGVWVIGVLLGIDLIFTGVTWIALAMKAKQLAQANP